MIDIEKVIKGLECCIKHDPDDKMRCGECPYEGACLNRLKADALALLKAHEPRVMTLEEFQASENNPKWIETKDGKHNRWTLGNAGYEKFYDNCMIGYLSIKEYGKRWRCWSAKPTDAQREAAPWEVGKP
jgi:hypothetical protein